MFSYGSGAEGEFYSAKVVEGYEKYVTDEEIAFLDQRTSVSVAEYEQIYRSFMKPQTADYRTEFENDPAPFVLKGQQQQQRIYEKVN